MERFAVTIYSVNPHHDVVREVDATDSNSAIDQVWNSLGSLERGRAIASNAKKIVSFDIPREEQDVIFKIVNRVKASNLFCRGPEARDILSLSMDLTAVHANGCPLDLDRLLVADEFDFVHDIVGIVRNLNRSTGKLSCHFHPRFARPAASTDCDDSGPSDYSSLPPNMES